jgi:hypothetical protein
MIRLRLAAVSAAVLLLRPPAGDAGVPRTIVDRTYACTIIASTREFPDGVDWLGPPALNAWGQVVFLARTRVGPAQDTVWELRVGRGEVFHGEIVSHAVAKAGDSFAGPLAPFGTIREAAIEDGARVVFLAIDPADGGPAKEGIYRVFTNHPAGSKPSPIIADADIEPSSPYVGFDPLDALGANPRSVVFQGITETFTAYFRDGTEIARNGENGIQIVSPPVLLHHAQPWTAFLASLDGSTPRQGLFVNGTLRAESTVDGDGSFTGLSIAGSQLPVVAYARSGFPGIDTWQLVATGPVGTSVLVDADEDPFEPFAAPSETSMNTWGDVAFVSSPDGDGDTLLVADGSEQIRRVVCQDHASVFGLPFFDFALSPRAINADGQIAFEGRTGLDTFLIRADPLPGQGAAPTDCTGLANGARCDDGDPITFSSCQAGACGGDPAYDPPSSCAAQEDGAFCNDGDPETISFCAGGACVGEELPVPESATVALGLCALASLAGARLARSERRR